MYLSRLWLTACEMNLSFPRPSLLEMAQFRNGSMEDYLYVASQSCTILLFHLDTAYSLSACPP
jgi:hypothetical protein